MAEEAVRLYATDNVRLPRTLRRDLEARRAELLSQILSAQSWDDFKLRKGHIAGLDEAIELCAEAEKKFG